MFILTTSNFDGPRYQQYEKVASLNSLFFAASALLVAGGCHEIECDYLRFTALFFLPFLLFSFSTSGLPKSGLILVGTGAWVVS